MVKHNQTIRRQQPTNCLSVFDHFAVLALKGLTSVDAAHGTILNRTGPNQVTCNDNIFALCEAKLFLGIYWICWSISRVIGEKMTVIFSFYSLQTIVVIWTFSYVREQSSRLSISHQHTYRPIYSPANKHPHLWHVKHHKCHCFSNASNACPLRMSFPQPAQSTSIEKIKTILTWIDLV